MAKASRTLIAALVLATSGCASPDLSVEDRIVRAALRTMVSDGKEVCVENRTRGAPLAVFRAMLEAPNPSRRPLAWHQAGALRPPPGLSNADLYRDQIEGQQTYLTEPGAGAARLSFDAQRSLEAAARKLAYAQPSPSNRVEGSWVPGVRSRWWLFNRLWQRCVPSYTISDPVWYDKTAFVTVSADHWATTYAAQPSGGDWHVVAQWSNWLY
jgi:hypothetical protein